MSNASIFSEHIHYHESTGSLCVSGIAAEDVAAEHGTPTYLYSLDQILANFRTIRTAYAAHHPHVTIHFSLKANANFTIVKALVKEGCGIDCVSAGEVYKALACGCDPDHVVFAGVGKSKEELKFAVNHKVGWFNVENELELHHLNALAESCDHRIRVALRLNPDVQAHTHPSIATGHGGAKFGLPIEVARGILERHSVDFPHLDFAGVHLHIGSQLGDTVQTKTALAIGLELVKPFSSVKHINIGGGMPVTYDDTVYPAPEDFAAMVCPMLSNYEVMLEPGRSIVGSGGMLLTRVLYRKDQAGQKILIVDASMTDLMRPALYQAKHTVLPLTKAVDGEPHDIFNIVGPVCETTDVLARNVSLPSRCGHPDALLVLMTAGAYGFSMANNYNAHPLPPQIVAHGGISMVSTKRQTFEDLIRDELDL